MCDLDYYYEEETKCDSCEFSFKDADCTAGIAVGERAYIYKKTIK